MKQIFFTAILTFGCFALSLAQNYPVKSIQDIQQRSQQDLQNCNDESSLNGDTVKVRGVVTMDGNLGRVPSDTNSRQVWIQNGTDPFSGIDVFNFDQPTTGVDILDLKRGDSIEILGSIDEFNGETEIIPLSTNNQQAVTLKGTSSAAQPTVVDVGQLNDQEANNQITTGEQYEGMYIKIEDVTVVSRDNFLGNRWSFVAEDNQGNKINISDKFAAQRTDEGFEVPPVGAFFNSLEGVLTHSKNNCPGTDGRGYELQPFDSSHYNYGPAPPFITEISRDKTVPSSSDSVTVTANIEDPEDNVASAYLYYATGVNDTNYTQVSMTNTSGSDYEASIPAQNNGTFVKYYLEATDDDTPPLTNTIPNVNSGNAAKFYRVRDDGLQIYDLQFTPYDDGNSGYADKEVTVSGVVTASVQDCDLGYVFIQQPDQQKWAGIQLTTGGGAIVDLKRGEQVEVTGTVEEDFGFTTLTNIQSVTTNGENSSTAPSVKPSVFTNYDVDQNEAYESMLVTLAHPDSQLYVVDENADSINGQSGPQFGEYRVGTDLSIADSVPRGCRVRTGRQFSGAGVMSSLHVSYINDSAWTSQDGIMEVPPRIVKRGQSMDSLTGIMRYDNSNMKLLPRNNQDFHGYSNAFDTTFCKVDSGIVTSTSTNPDAQSSALNVFPNPTQEKLNVEWDHEHQNLPVEIAIMNVLGKTVYQKGNIGSSESTQLNLKSLKPGYYLLIVKNAQQGEVVGKQKILIR